MLYQWSNVRRQQIVNAVLANFAIPVEVHPPVLESTDAWTVVVNGGTIVEVIETCRAKQDRIFNKVDRYGLDSISRQEALFMYASQWLEWRALRGPNDQDDAEMDEMMEKWLVIWYRKGEQHLN